MHLIATYFPFFMHCAFRTSEKVPSPFFASSRYSAGQAVIQLATYSSFEDLLHYLKAQGEDTA